MTMQDIHAVLLEDSNKPEQGTQTEELQAGFLCQVNDLMAGFLEQVIARSAAAQVDTHDIEPAFVQVHDEIVDGRRGPGVLRPQ